MKVYDEKEIGSILKRASELSHDDANSNSMGLSLSELEQLGKEAGISPDHIRKAAAEMGISKSSEKESGLFGPPASYTNQIVLDTEITPEDWEEMLVQIRTCFKEPGSVSTRKNTYEWTIQGTALKAQVTARLDKGKTHVNVFWAEPASAIPFFIPSIIGTIISLPITFEALNLGGFPGLFVIMSTFLTLFSLGRWGVSKVVQKQSDKLDQMITSLELIAARSEGMQKAEEVKSLQESLATRESILDDDASEPQESETSRIHRRDRA